MNLPVEKINELLWSNKDFMLYLKFWLDRGFKGLGPRNWGCLIPFNHSPSRGPGPLPCENIFERGEVLSAMSLVFYAFMVMFCSVPSNGASSDSNARHTSHSCFILSRAITYM